MSDREESPSAALLGLSGPFAASIADYEPRLGQLQMATAVEQALKEQRVLLCEAGTGTGKTLAYLVPAILSGRKVIVSTATRALQEQIFFKDFPLIARALGTSPNVALLKGIGNYLCRRRYEAFRRSAEAERPQYAAALGAVDSWVLETQSGDLAELAGLSESDATLTHVASSSETRVGAGCQFYEDCFVTRAKREAEQAQIVVVNHHLFFADLALRGPHPGRVLPDYDAVIFDEAHQLEDTATLFFGVRVSEARVELFLRELQRTVERVHAGGPLFDDAGGRLLEDARRAVRSFWATLVECRADSGEGRSRLERDFWVGAPRDAYHALDNVLEGLMGLADASQAKVNGILDGGRLSLGARRDASTLGDAFEVASRRAAALRSDLATMVEGAPGRITWLDLSERTKALSSAPVDVGDVFRDRLFGAIPSVVLTSATLSNGGPSESPFRFLRSRLGISETDRFIGEVVVPSPFDYESRALLYVPDDLPLPGEKRFAEESLERIVDLLDLTEGGAFILSTSLRAMRWLHERLAARVRRRRVYVQGAAPKATLLSAFRAAGDAVLVATSSFWQGVDVPGSSLRLVVLDKIPFPVPSDPIVQARSEAIDEEGGNAFMELHVPLAEMTLKQGFGRLIRGHSDYGVVALLDGRVHRRGYGRRLLGALPPAQRTTKIEEVEDFWRRRR